MSEAATTMSDRQMTNHDFVNCLSSVRSLTELLADYSTLETDDCIQFLNIIREEMNRLADLLADLKSIPDHDRAARTPPAVSPQAPAASPEPQ
jgi:signal transduction histidine kinase